MPGRKYMFPLIIIWLLSCIKPYDLEISLNSRLLVVDGLVSNTGNTSVKLHYSSPLDTSQNLEIRNATVTIENSNKEVVNLAYESDSYKPTEPFIGEIGESYKLRINLPDGSTYTSDFQTLVASPPIDSVYDQYAELPSDDGESYVGGIQFFLDTHDETGNARYFRYEWEEGYKIVVPFPATFELITTIDRDTSIQLLDEEIGVCFLQGKSTDLIYASSEGKVGNRVVEVPLRFVSKNEQHLRIRYSILAKQYAISQSAYNYYKRLYENTNSGGSLFDPQSGELFGNVYNENDPTDRALGFFEVSGYSNKRTFFNNEDLDPELGPIEFLYTCYDYDIVETTIDSAQYYLDLTGGNIYDYIQSPTEGSKVYIHRKHCTDCSFWAKLETPDYWFD